MPLYDPEFAGKKLISSDPTPSLSDIFEFSLTAEEQQIAGVNNLYALEIQSEVILQKWKERFGPEIHQVLMAFSNLDYDFIDYIGGAPGIEEEYMLNFIKELTESGVEVPLLAEEVKGIKKIQEIASILFA